MLAHRSLASCFHHAFRFGSAPRDKVGPGSRRPAGGANQKEHTLLVVDPEKSPRTLKNLRRRERPRSLVSKDGHFAYVPIYGNSGVGRPGRMAAPSMSSTCRSAKLIATIDLGKPLRPNCAEFGPDGLLYVTAELRTPSTSSILQHAKSSWKFPPASRNPTCW